VETVLYVTVSSSTQNVDAGLWCRNISVCIQCHCHLLPSWGPERGQQKALCWSPARNVEVKHS